MTIFAASVVAMASGILPPDSAISPLEQGELVEIDAGDGTQDGGCGIIAWFAEYRVQRRNGEMARLYLMCPKMAPTIPKVGDVCRFTYTLGRIEAVIPADDHVPAYRPEGDEMIIDQADCGSHHREFLDTMRGPGEE